MSREKISKKENSSNPLAELEKRMDEIIEMSDHEGFVEEEVIDIDFENIDEQLKESKKNGEKQFKELKEKFTKFSSQ